MTACKLSIIVPVYNGEKRIRRCIQSILNQSYRNFELILIDDGSSDSSCRVMEEYQSREPERVRLLHQENMGAAKTRNRGIALALGEWVTFVDQDDYIAPDYCAAFMSLTGHGDDILIGGYERVEDTENEDCGGRALRHTALQGKKWDPFMVVAPWAHFYRKNFLLENHIDFLPVNIGEDVYFNLVAYAYTDRIRIVCGECGYKWVFNRQSVSNSQQNVVTEKNNPMELLCMLQERYRQIGGDNRIEPELLEYYFVRYVVWYGLFTLRGSRRSAYRARMKELFCWLKDAYPEYRSNPYLKKRVPGEGRFIFWLVKGYLLFKDFLV